VKTTTYSVGTQDKSRTLITAFVEGLSWSAASEIVTSFTTSDYMTNVAHVCMSPAEARDYAKQLLAAADKLDPIV